MLKKSYKARAKVWLYPGMAGWHFVMFPKKQSAEIRARFGALAAGWGSLQVIASILRRRSGQVGKTSWKTSIFPDKKAGAYLLPLKADVRKRENIKNGDTITLSVEIRT